MWKISFINVLEHLYRQHSTC